MDYLQEGIGLRAMAQRDPLVEYQREGYDMFAAMMEAIQEESVGFLFNLEVEVEPASAEALPDGGAPGGRLAVAPMGAGPDGTGTYPAGEGAGAGADLDAEAVLAAIASGETEPRPGSHPHITAKGLDRSDQNAPLTYSAPALGSDTPEVHTEGGQQPSASRAAKAANQRRSNPNRGSRGNKRKR
jgi:preprotein translocase subunit SecA